MRECRMYGSVRGVRSNAHSYRNSNNVLTRILESRPTLGCGGELGLDYRVRSSRSRCRRRRRPRPSRRNRAIVC
jgi:hypothetical protein